MIDPAFNTFVAAAFTVLFAVAAVHKVRARAAFVATIAEYRIVPRGLLQPAGALLIVLEVALAVGLLWPATRVASAVLGASLLLVYGIAIGVNVLRGRRDIDCGCSFQHRPIGPWMVVRNVALAVVLLVLTLPLADRTLTAGDITSIVAALIVAALLYASLDLLLGRGQVPTNINSG